MKKSELKLYIINLVCVASSIRLLPHIALFLSSNRRHLIEADVIRWTSLNKWSLPKGKIGIIIGFVELMTRLKEYRNVFYLRLGFLSRCIAWLCPPLEGLVISCPDVGPGFYIQHGVATLISADRIGGNCTIFQQVTIGYSNETDRPTLGNDVSVRAGAKIIGKISVGDHAIVGANTVVLGNVPANATVFGVPGRVVWRRRDSN